jgi:hypothetical protein
VKRWPWELKLLHLLYLAKKQKLMEEEAVRWQGLQKNIPRSLESRGHVFRFS